MQLAVDAENHLIVTHEVTNSGSDRAQLASLAKQAKAVLQTETLDAVADRGYFNSPEILACHEAGIMVTLPKPLTSGAKSKGRFGKQDFAYLPEQNVYRCPPGERLSRVGSTTICSRPCKCLDANPQAMGQHRETVEHPFATIKARMGATHFLTKALPNVAAEMALSVLAYNLTRVINIVGIKPLIAAIAA